MAVGIGASEQEVTAGLIGVAILGLALTTCLWWAHFGEHGHERLEQAFAETTGRRRHALALNVYYWHLLLLLGIVALASALEEAIAHPGEALSLAQALALGGATGLFLFGTALIRRSLAHRPSGRRLAAAGISIATVPLGVWAPAVFQLAVLVAGLSLYLAVEYTLEAPSDPRL